MPFQSVLGGSSLFVLLTLADLREFYDLDRRILNDYVVAELAQRVEAEELGITCGDRVWHVHRSALQDRSKSLP